VKRILIWESLNIIAGGQRVSLNVSDALKNHYSCFFFLPAKGPLADALEGKNIPYFLLPLGNYSTSRKSLIDVIKLIFRFPYTFLKAYNILKSNGCDLIYANAARAFIWATLLGKVLSIPVIWHVHNCFNDRKSIVLLNLMGQLKSVKRVVFVSNTVREQFPKLNNKSEVIYNSIDETLFTNENLQNGNSMRDLGVPEGKKVVSTIGLIMPEKGQDVFLKAMPMVLKEYKDVHFLIIGGVRDSHYYQRLLKQVNTLKLDSYVTFTGHRTDIPEIFKMTYLNTINSVVRFEACPLVILEGGASSVPTIGSDIGGTSELIKHLETGLLYERNNEKKLAEAIVKLLKDEELYKNMRENCVKYSRIFDSQEYREKIYNVVSQVIGFKNENTLP
jgi:glycosyltransferase involved in cell wall biosynthesis